MYPKSKPTLNRALLSSKGLRDRARAREREKERERVRGGGGERERETLFVCERVLVYIIREYVVCM